MRKFYSPAGLDPEFRQAFNIENSSSYNLVERREKTAFDVANIRPFLYRPFDCRWIYYSSGITSRSAWEVMRHLLAFENLALLTMRQSRRGEPGPFFIGRGLINKDGVSPFDICTVLPLYVLRDAPKKRWNIPAGSMMLFEDTEGYAARTPNLNPTFVAEFAKRVKLEWQESGPGDGTRTFGPEDVFYYLYAVLHAPAYRERYAEFLKIDFPRLPLPADAASFRTLCGLGRDLAALHLLEAPALANPGSSFPVSGSNSVGKGFPKYLPEPQRVLINAEQYFADVPPEIWAFRVGGYQVCEKWLKDRRGRILDFNDLIHYRKIITALSATRRLMTAVDEAVTFL